MHGPLNVKSFIYAFLWIAVWELPTFAVVKQYFMCDGRVHCEREVVSMFFVLFNYSRIFG